MSGDFENLYLIEHMHAVNGDLSKSYMHRSYGTPTHFFIMSHGLKSMVTTCFEPMVL